MVFLTSGLNRVPSPVRGIQNATQAAVDCFAACLRQEMRTRGVDVSVVAAGEFSPGNGWLNETELRDQVRKGAWTRSAANGVQREKNSIYFGYF